MILNFRLFSKRVFCPHPAHQNEDQKVEFPVRFFFAVITPLSVLTTLKDKISRKRGRRERYAAHAQGIAPTVENWVRGCAPFLVTNPKH